jgi:hypothetical protein
MEQIHLVGCSIQRHNAEIHSIHRRIGAEQILWGGGMERGNCYAVKGARGFGNRFITTNLDSDDGDK